MKIHLTVVKMGIFLPVRSASDSFSKHRMVRSNFEPGHVPHFVAASLCKKLPKTVPWKVQKAAKAAKPEERTGTSWAKWRNDRDITGYM